MITTSATPAPPSTIEPPVRRPVPTESVPVEFFLSWIETDPLIGEPDREYFRSLLA